MIETIESVNGAVNSAVWGLPGLILLIGTGILLTLGTKIFQISHVRHWWKNTIATVFKKDSSTTKTSDKKNISQFQALCAALAATVGTGNIAGVAAAIVTGGPGAVFWMWVAAFFGMMTNFSENVLGIYYRRKKIKTASGPAAPCTTCGTVWASVTAKSGSVPPLRCWPFYLPALPFWPLSASATWHRSTRSC